MLRIAQVSKIRKIVEDVLLLCKQDYINSYLFIFGDIFNYLYYFKKKMYYTIDDRRIDWFRV